MILDRYVKSEEETRRDSRGAVFPTGAHPPSTRVRVCLFKYRYVSAPAPLYPCVCRKVSRGGISRVRERIHRGGSTAACMLCGQSKEYYIAQTLRDVLYLHTIHIHTRTRVPYRSGFLARKSCEGLRFSSTRTARSPLEDPSVEARSSRIYDRRKV